MSSVANSSNAADYQFLVKSLSEGNVITKSQSLKRLNNLVSSDKKQFSIYAKRIVLALQQLMLQPKQDINLLSSTLALQIINLNPRQIQYYVRSKLLKQMVKNLGDSKPQIRKTSHYCLLAYVKTYKSFQELIQVYLTGVMSQDWQLRQKCINSLQSILIMEMKYLNWGVQQFKKMFQVLLQKLKDQSAYVQKASQQCLLSLCKMDELRMFSKTLTPKDFMILKNFCQTQHQSGNLQQIKIDIQQKKISIPGRNFLQSRQQSSKQLSNTGNSLQNLQKFRLAQENSQKRSIINRIQQIRRNNILSKPEPQSTPRKTQSIIKTQSIMLVSQQKQLKKKLSQKQKQKTQIKLEPIRKQVVQEEKQIVKEKQSKETIGRRIVDDLRNDKDWKVRLQAIQDFQNKFDTNRDAFDLETLTKTYLPILVKLLGDANFKVALISLKIIQDIILLPNISLQNLVPQLMQRLSDNKIALRQNISKLIRSQYIRTKQSIWIDSLLAQVKKVNNSNTKEEILSILSKLYEEKYCQKYSILKVVQTVCPLMEDLKTKIKIKTLDLLVLMTVRASDQDSIKNLLMSKLNQVYYQMYSQKLNKQVKVRQKQKQNTMNVSTDDSMPVSSASRSVRLTGSTRRYNKNPVASLQGNTTSTSLPRNSLANQTARTSSFLQRPPINSSIQLQSSNSKLSLHQRVQKLSPKKSFIKSFRKKNRLDQRNNSASEEYQPFVDPEKELRNLLQEIRSDDWQVSFEALNKTKRIVCHHKELLTQPVLKILVPQIVRHIQNLRSSLSKNAVVTLNQLTIQVKRGLDSELDLIFNKLIKKSLDTNSFISDQVKKVLVCVCSNCNESKVVSLLTASHTVRAIPIKQVIAHILQSITFMPRFFDKQLQKIVLILNDFMSQGSLQIRQKTKAILIQILASQKGKQITRLISQEHLEKLRKKVIDKVPQLKIIQKQQNYDPVKQQKQQNKDFYQLSQKKKKQKISIFPEEFQKIQGLLEKCQSSDWKVRSQSMSQINQIYISHAQQASQHKINIKFIDVLSKQIGDPNIKVATNALRIFKNLCPLIPSLIQNNLSVITNQVFNCFASQKQDVKVLSEQFFDVICQNVENWMLLQHLCNGVLYGVQKSKTTIIQKLTMIVTNAIRVKPNIFQKNVYPMINKTVEEGKPEFLLPLKILMNTIYDEVGENCMDYLKPRSKQLMKQ